MQLCREPAEWSKFLPKPEAPLRWQDLGHLDYDHDAVEDHVWQDKNL